MRTEAFTQISEPGVRVYVPYQYMYSTHVNSTTYSTKYEGEKRKKSNSCWQMVFIVFGIKWHTYKNMI